MQSLASHIKDHKLSADFWSLLILNEKHEEFSIRNGVQIPARFCRDRGAIVCVIKKGAMGYGSTQDLSPSGISQAYERAYEWTEKFGHYSLLKDTNLKFETHTDNYKSLVEKPMQKIDFSTKLDLLQKAEKNLRSSDKIIDSEASLWSINTLSYFYNSHGAQISQEISRIIPALSVGAAQDTVSVTRTLGGMRALCQQGGLENIENINLEQKAQELAKDAVDLVHAPKCPSEVLDCLIDPDQMMMQIHESIGHPVELDRILGDERNYAGTSFVNLDMFGSYQYGSKLLNITFDPSIKSQFASYGYDDEGKKAQKEFIIKNGILVKPLGGSISQVRANMSGVANARSSSWNRPPIDRMANLNLEPGNSSFAEMLENINHGIYLKSNSSWSIDDSRNKFQFGCEWGQLIEKGKLTKVVRNPNYRGISANFWRNLHMVGNKDTRMILGSPYCGKGEPNQCIRVGHASPVCLFKNIDVFGGE